MAYIDSLSVRSTGQQDNTHNEEWTKKTKKVKLAL
jgi:hypothetical protein